MNVGGHRLTNEELRGHFAAMGFAEVASFRASGNVIFAAPAGAPDDVAARIEQGLAEALGYEVPTFIRSSAQMRTIAASQPFTADRLAASAGKLQVALLAAPPPRDAREAVLALGGDSDALAFGECELYWLPSGGLLDSPLDLKAVAALLGVITIRTKNTIEQIAAKHFAD
jgi:uncharacterized protein (DUF1697 family)